MLSTSPSESSAGPNAELVAGRGCEQVMIAHEGASYDGDSLLPKIGENGFCVQIPQHQVINLVKVIGRTVDHRHVFFVCRNIEREDQSGLLGERPQYLTRLRVDDGESPVYSTGND